MSLWFQVFALLDVGEVVKRNSWGSKSQSLLSVLSFTLPEGGTDARAENSGKR